MQNITHSVGLTPSKTAQSSSIQITARLAIGAIITYQVLLASLIFLRPDLDPYWHTISEWAIGPYGWMMSAAFLTAAIAYGALVAAIRREVKGVIGKTGLGILMICTIGLIGVGLFTTDPLDTPPGAMTTIGILHLISGASQLMLLPFAALLINLNLARRNPAFAASRRILIATAGLPLLGLAGFIIHLIVYIIPLGETAYGPGVPIGWPPRFLFLSYMVWLIVLAVAVIKADRRKSKMGRDIA